MTRFELGKSWCNDIYWDRFDSDQHIQIFFGGSSAGKSVFVAQRMIFDLLKGGRNYLVVRNVGRTNRQSTFALAQKVITDWGVRDLFKINKSELTITCSNGYQSIFSGLDDVEKLKSITALHGILTDIWIEEATETSNNTLLHLERRLRGESKHSKRITMTFNPILQSHWIYKKYFNNFGDNDNIFESKDLLILRTTYKNNKFLSDQDRQILENEKDKYFYDVYTLGKWGVLGKTIFTDFEIQDLSHHTFENHRYGQDFGFGGHPAAFIESAINFEKKEIYILNEIYEKGLTNPVLANMISPYCERHRVMCDEAEPKSIAELNQNGIMAVGAKKGKDSVLFGIQWLRQFNVIIDKKCQNTINEFQLYKWQEDRHGEATQTPVKKNDHAIDAIRYSFAEDMQQRKKVSRIT